GLRAWPRRAAWTLGGALWIGGLLGYLVDLGRAGAAGTSAPREWPVWIVLALAVTWASDVAAYAVGSVWGRRALAPRLSPGKTWEGTLAGFVAAALVALLAVPLAGIPAGPALVIALLAGPAALAGDLAESAVKRRAGVKDSGTLLPGHGGVFDRIDSLLGVAPVVALALRLAAGP
ncbi:MAG: phosphatidate cytidylyltransferase, partial [Candidatus Limnocylindria bacterium]|nr:phosphatidate cytidylyltransferase [Candidatus Limnocylindria bacterium]